MCAQWTTRSKVFLVLLIVLLLLTVIARISYSRHLHGLLCAAKTFHQYTAVSDKEQTPLVVEPDEDIDLSSNDLEVDDDKAIAENFRNMQRLLEQKKHREQLWADQLEKKSSKSGKREQVLPQVIIIGVRKCGTRALLEMLETHPQIAASGPEVHFFDRHYNLGLDWYRRQMKASVAGQITIEKTPSYFITEEAPKRIFKMNPDTLLLVILRDPTTRVISDFTQIANKDESRIEGQTFEETVVVRNRVQTSYKAIQISTYANYIDHWLDYFPLSQIHIVDGDKLISNPLPEMKEVEKFVGISDYISSDTFYYNATRGFYCLAGDRNAKCLASGKGREHPSVSPDVIAKLQTFFRPHNERLYQKIQHRFDWA